MFVCHLLLDMHDEKTTLQVQGLDNVSKLLLNTWWQLYHGHKHNNDAEANNFQEEVSELYIANEANADGPILYMCRLFSCEWFYNS